MTTTCKTAVATLTALAPTFAHLPASCPIASASLTAASESAIATSTALAPAFTHLPTAETAPLSACDQALFSHLGHKCAEFIQIRRQLRIALHALVVFGFGFGKTLEHPLDAVCGIAATCKTTALAHLPTASSATSTSTHPAAPGKCGRRGLAYEAHRRPGPQSFLSDRDDLFTKRKAGKNF